MKRMIVNVLRNAFVLAAVLGLASGVVACGSKKPADVEIKVPDNAFPSSSTEGKRIEMDR